MKKVAGNFVFEDQLVKGTLFLNSETGVIESFTESIDTKDSQVDSYLQEGQLIFPGFGDIHVHAREDETKKQTHKEDYTTLTQAAHQGGVTFVGVMPNTPSPMTTKSQLEWHRKRTREEDLDFFFYVGIGPGTQPLDETVPYKLYTAKSVGDLFFKDWDTLKKTLQNYRKQWVSFHVEDPFILDASNKKKYHWERRPEEAIVVALKKVIHSIKELEIKAKFCHWPVGGDAFAMIETLKVEGGVIETEVSPLHLVFSKEKAEKEWWRQPWLQMNPSVQTESHSRELTQALKRNAIEYLATDHAPHTIEEKLVNFGGDEAKYQKMIEEHPEKAQELCCQNGTSGTSQLDTYGQIVSWLMKEKGFTPFEVRRVASSQPGAYMTRFCYQGRKYGELKPGFEGSLSVLDLNLEHTFDRSQVRSRAGWSPFEGMIFPGRAIATYVSAKRCEGLSS